MPGAGSFTHAHNDREATILMIQWVVWKHIGPKIIMDGERMQRLAEELAEAFYNEGVRMPLDDDPLETTITLQSELLCIVKSMPPIPVPQIRIRERARTMAQGLYKSGWRKFVAAAALALI